MQNEFLISIIIPVYNVQNYLEQCIESILNQEYKRMEIILVDDGSTDTSGAICDKYSNENECVKVIHKANGGLSDARNCGVSHACGDYILFIDSDDYICPGSLQKIADTVNKNPVDIVFLEAQKVFPNGKTVPLGDGIIKSGIYKKSKNEVLDFISTCPKYPASACTKLINKALFEKKELLFEKNLLSEDLDWCLKLILNSNSFDYCDIMYYNYRQNRIGSITNSISIKNLNDLVYILEKWVEFSKNADEHAKNFILSEMAYEFPILLMVYGICKNKEKINYKNRIKQLSFLINQRKSSKYIIFKFIYRLFGMNVTSNLLQRLF